MSFEPVFRVSELRGPVVCGAERAEVCAIDDQDLVRDLMIASCGDAGCDAGSDAGPDAGVDSGSGCGCTAAGTGTPSLPWFLVAALAWALRRRRAPA